MKYARRRLRNSSGKRRARVNLLRSSISWFSRLASASSAESTAHALPMRYAHRNAPRMTDAVAITTSAVVMSVTSPKPTLVIVQKPNSNAIAYSDQSVRSAHGWSSNHWSAQLRGWPNSSSRSASPACVRAVSPHMHATQCPATMTSAMNLASVIVECGDEMDDSSREKMRLPRRMRKMRMSRSSRTMRTALSRERNGESSATSEMTSNGNVEARSIANQPRV